LSALPWPTVAALLLTALPLRGFAAMVYDITVNSSSVASTAGYLDVQFNPGQSTGAPQAIATISQFVLGGGALSGATPPDGDVTGSLPGVVVFGNGSLFNAILQPLSPIGNSI
jgi:hypothetical protein